MVILNGSGHKLQAVMGAAHTTTLPTYFVSYVSINANSLVTSNNAQGNLNDTSQVAMLTGSSSYQYKISALDIYNADTIAQTITVSILISATTYNLYVVTLDSKESLHYTDGGGWYKTTSGGLKVATSTTNPVNVQVFNTFGAQTWVKPTTFTPSSVYVICVGAGGSGGSGGSGTSGTITTGGSGGGGGAMSRKHFNAANLGASVPMVVGAGGLAPIGVNASVGNVGANGGASIFGGYTQAQSLVFAGGGGGGYGGRITGAAGYGGSGGGVAGNGAVGAAAGTVGGLPNGTSTTATSGAGAEANTGVNGGYAEFGGAAGAGWPASGVTYIAGTSMWGGGGGGAGGGASAVPGLAAPSAGGYSGPNTPGSGGGGGAGTGGSSPTAGSPGTATSAGACTTCFSGQGGGGGGSTITASTAGAAGGAGGFPGGGGGGGGSNFSSGGTLSGAGGAGGDGCIWVFCW